MTLVIVGLLFTVFGFSGGEEPQKTPSYAGIEVTQKKLDAINQLTTSEHLLLYQMHKDRLDVDKIKSKTSDVYNNFLAVNGDTEVERGLTTGNLSSVEGMVQRRLTSMKFINSQQVLKVDVFGMYKLNKRAALKLAKQDEKKAQKIFNQLQTDASLEKTDINDFYKVIK